MYPLSHCLFRLQVVCFVVSLILISDMFAADNDERKESIEVTELATGVTSTKILALLKRIQSTRSSNDDSGSLHGTYELLSCCCGLNTRHRMGAG